MHWILCFDGDGDGDDDDDDDDDDDLLSLLLILIGRWLYVGCGGHGYVLFWLISLVSA